MCAPTRPADSGSLGQFAKHICRIVHQAPDGLTTGEIIWKTKLSARQVTGLLQELVAGTYLSTHPEEPRLWKTTEKGRMFSYDLSESLEKSQVQTLLRDVLNRVQAINEKDVYAYRVDSVRVLGECAPQANPCGNLDLVVTVAKRSIPDWETHCHNRIRQAPPHILSNNVKRYYWPIEEVLRAIKSDHPKIILHSAHEVILQDPSCHLQQVYPNTVNNAIHSTL